MNEPSDSAFIEFHFDELYTDQVTNHNKPDSWIEISVLVNNTYIYGDDEGGVRGFACGVALDFLQSIRAILSNEQFIIEFEYGPTWLVLDPIDEQTINVVKSVTLKGARNPADRLDVDTSRRVTKQAWIEAVLKATERYYSKIICLNPETETNDTVKQIRDEIDAVENMVGY